MSLDLIGCASALLLMVCGAGTMGAGVGLAWDPESNSVRVLAVGIGMMLLGLAVLLTTAGIESGET